MTRERLANAFDQAAEAMAALALELRANEPGVARAPVAASVPPAAPVGGPPPLPAGAPHHSECESLRGGQCNCTVTSFRAAPIVDTGRCPKHGTPWEPGNFGPYCKQMTDDPAWGKAKTDRDGNPVLWCKITPKNAPDWLLVHGQPA